MVTRTRTGDMYGEGPLTGAVALARGTKPNQGDLAERKPRKYISLLTFLWPSYLQYFPFAKPYWKPECKRYSPRRSVS